MGTPTKSQARPTTQLYVRKNKEKKNRDRIKKENKKCKERRKRNKNKTNLKKTKKREKKKKKERKTYTYTSMFTNCMLSKKLPYMCERENGLLNLHLRYLGYKGYNSTVVKVSEGE